MSTSWLKTHPHILGISREKIKGKHLPLIKIIQRWRLQKDSTMYVTGIDLRKRTNKKERKKKAA